MFSVHSFGSQIKFFIHNLHGEELAHRYNSLYNFGLTSGELHILTEDLAYVWTNKKRLDSYFVLSSLFKILGEIDKDKGTFKRFKGLKGGAMGAARELALKRQNEVIWENSEEYKEKEEIGQEYRLSQRTVEDESLPYYISHFPQSWFNTPKTH